MKINKERYLFKVKSKITGYIYNVYKTRNHRYGAVEYYIYNYNSTNNDYEWWNSERFEVLKVDKHCFAITGSEKNYRDFRKQEILQTYNVDELIEHCINEENKNDNALLYLKFLHECQYPGDECLISDYAYKKIKNILEGIEEE